MPETYPLSPVGYNLISLSDVKTIMKLDSTNSDDILNLLIFTTSSIIETYVDRQFLTRTYTNEIQDGDGTNIIITKQWPINTFTSLYVDSNRLFEDTALRDSTTYVVNSENGIIILDEEVYKGNGNIQLTYNAGFETTPGDIQSIAFEIVLQKFQSYADRTVGFSSKSQRDVNFGMSLGDILPDHKIILNRYKRVPI